MGPAVRVSIFLSPLDVHVNRSPIAGLVVGTVYTPGPLPGRLSARGRRGRTSGARCRSQGEATRVTVVQIAGVVARRIVCRVGPGDKLAAGERFGMIRFGSRTDCYMPRGTEVPGPGRATGSTRRRDRDRDADAMIAAARASRLAAAALAGDA